MRHDDTCISAIDAIAFDWVARLDKAPLNASDASALQCWLESDRRHRGAFVRAQSIWMSAGRMAALHGTPLPVPARALPRRLFLRGAAAAGLAGATLLAGRTADASEIYHASAGVLHITQPDCGDIVLDQGAILRVRRTTGVPAFDLLEGRLSLASFRAPLFLNMDGLALELQPSGKLVAHAAGRESDALILQGHAFSYGLRKQVKRALNARDWIRSASGSVTVTRLDDDEMERAVAWSEGKIEFQSVDVVDAIAQMNRYNTRKIVLSSPACAHRKISGIFVLDNPLVFAHVLGEVFGVRINISAEKITLL